MKSTWPHHVAEPQTPFPRQGDLKHIAFPLLLLWECCLLFWFVLNVGLFGHSKNFQKYNVRKQEFTLCKQQNV